MMRLPLDGITVVALEQAVAAPLATRHLADWGARVIKVERPGVGDFARHYDTTVMGQTSHFVWLNRTKESLTLDLKHPTAIRALRALIANADVFIQNLAPGATDRLGLGAKALRAEHPRLITCDVSGYGSEGPYRDKKAYDLLVQAEAGLISITGTEETPSKVGISIADIACGMYAFSGILTALFGRERTGDGAAIEVSLFDALSEWMGYPAYFTGYGGAQPARTGANHATIAPYGPFATGDGKSVYLAVQNDREWASFTQKVVPALAADPRFETNSARVKHRADLHQAIEAAFKTQTADQVIQLLDQADIANAQMRSVEEFLQHPQIHERGRLREVQSEAGPIWSFRPAVTIPGLEPALGPIPKLGQHTTALLKEAGLTDPEIAELQAANAI
jgi:itaconate CoA-transferase